MGCSILPFIILFLQYVPHSIVFFSVLTHSFPYEPPTAQSHGQLLPRVGEGSGKQRDVFLHFKYVPIGPVTKSDGTTVFSSHSALYIEGNKKDGLLKIEITVTPNKEYELRYYDMTTALNGVGKKPSSLKKIFKQGTTTMNNDEFLDRQGTGPVWDALVKDSTYRSGAPNKDKLNTCPNVNTRILNNIGIQVSPEAQQNSDLYDTHSFIVEKKEITKPIRKIQVEAPAAKKRSKVIREHAIDPAAPGESGCKRKTKRTGDCTVKPITTEGGETTPMQNELAAYDIASQIPADGLDITATDPDQDAPAGKPPAEDTKGTKVSVVRAGGTFTSFMAVGKEALGALGVAGTVVGAVFVILDFVQHDWVGGAIGGIGLAVGVAAGFAVSGPVGWVIGGATAALFAILPGLFKDTHPPADRTDTQGIIQWKLFGDKAHTGNEQCQKGTSDVPGNKDCQALYGAGTLSMAMGMNNFDAIVFLQQFNNGYPMTIRDIAAAFYVVDPNKKGDGGDKIATIECHNTKGTPAGRAGVLGGESRTVCDKPEFKIKREKIVLPNIDDTADKVINRIMPAPNGDCKLIAYPGDQYFPNYNITMNGLPSAIACGLTAAINVAGTAVPVEGDTNGQKPQKSSDPGKSTEGQGGAFVAPPPKVPFKPLAQTDYACIIHGTDRPLCLPPGSYGKQSGLGFEIKNVDSLTLPPGGGWSLATRWKQIMQPHERGGPKYTDRTYKGNQDPTKKSAELTIFQDDMQALDTNLDGEATFTIVGPGDGPDPVCCLFTEPKFGGNVWCMGVGGGDALPQWKDRAQSISCHNGGQVWLYAAEYGDAGAALIKGNVEDLKDEPYGKDKDSFSKKVKALWVLKG